VSFDGVVAFVLIFSDLCVACLTLLRAHPRGQYCVFTALCQKDHAVTAANRILRYVQREQNNLFIFNAPSWT
jgi:hypothetical protein